MSAKFNMVIPDELLDRVKEVARRQGKTVSEIIRNFLEQYSNEEPEETRLEALERRVDELEKEVHKK